MNHPNPPTPAPASLGQRSIAAVFWGTGGTVLRMVMQIAAQVVLARILGPAQYGIFAIGATVISFSAFFSDFGLAYGLIQKPEVDDRDLRFVFTWQCLLGTAVTAAVWALAAPIAGFFNEPRAVPVLQVLSVLCLLNALAAPSLNMLKRRIDFKRIQIAQLASYVLGYLMVGIPLALAGAMVWALVAAWVTQSLSAMVLLYLGARHPVKPLLWHPMAGQQAGYGATVFVTNLVNWVINNVDRVIVGRVFGSRDIGLYATSYNLLYNPTASVLGVVQPVFFSASSRVADDSQRILRGYRMLVSAVAMLALPAFVVVAVASEAFIGMLYGDAWAHAAALCRPIALAMPFFLLWGFTTPLLWTSGSTRREVLVQLPVAVLWVAVCLAAATQAVHWVAWSVLALYACRCTVVVVAAMRTVGLPARDLWRCLRGGLAVSGAVALAAAAANHMALAQPHALRAAASAAAAALAWWLCLRLVPGLVASDLAGLFDKVAQKLPPRLRGAVASLARKDTPT